MGPATVRRSGFEEEEGARTAARPMGRSRSGRALAIEEGRGNGV